MMNKNYTFLAIAALLITAGSVFCTVSEENIAIKKQVAHVAGALLVAAEEVVAQAEEVVEQDDQGKQQEIVE